MQPALAGFLVESTLGRNRAQRHAALAEIVHRGIALEVGLPLGLPLRPHPRCDTPRWPGGVPARVASSRCRRGWAEDMFNPCTMLLQHLIERSAEVLQQMPPVGN